MQALTPFHGVGMGRWVIKHMRKRHVPLPDIIVSPPAFGMLLLAALGMGGLLVILLANMFGIGC